MADNPVEPARKPFSELRAQMSPEAQARAVARTAEMSREIDAPASVPPPSEKQCPHGENCACAISTRHEWFEAFCQEREKHRASSPAVPPEGKDDHAVRTTEGR